MSKSKFTRDEITRSLNILERKISRISVIAEIINHYFEPGKFLITHRTTGLYMFISELAIDIHCQLCRCCFDKSNKFFLVASICEIYKNIEFYVSAGEREGINHKKQFFESKKTVDDLICTYEKKLKTFCDKNHSHIEIRALDEAGAKVDYANIQAAWTDVEPVLTRAKLILNSMFLFWENRESSFESGHYAWIKNDFLGLIDLPKDASNPSDPRWYGSGIVLPSEPRG